MQNRNKFPAGGDPSTAFAHWKIGSHTNYSSAYSNCSQVKTPLLHNTLGNAPLIKYMRLSASSKRLTQVKNLQSLK